MCQPAVITTTENVVGKVTAKAENLTILLSGISWPLQHVYEHLDDDVDTSTELELLQSNIEDNGELDCDGFVVWPENVASIWFDDSTMMEEIEDQDFMIDNAARLSYMREKLQGSLLLCFSVVSE